MVAKFGHGNTAKYRTIEVSSHFNSVAEEVAKVLNKVAENDPLMEVVSITNNNRNNSSFNYVLVTVKTTYLF